MKSVLFIAKKGQGYSKTYGCNYVSSGLMNSARFVVEMLRDHGVKADLVQVIDNNDIDREVTKFRPDIVIIEALWVVPEKFDILKKLHPNVEWVIRVHSEIPFLAQEGIAVKWISEYLAKPRVWVAFNSLRTARDFVHTLGPGKILYLPNYFPVEDKKHRKKKDDGFLDIGCFGAIRPLKDQLIQAFAAIRFADEEKKILRFHINVTRVEGGDEILKNLRALFEVTRHQLIEHEWFKHDKFRHELSDMDIAMCVSFSETFCIVAADAVSEGVPLVCSPEVRWASKISYADTTSTHSIVDALRRVTHYESPVRFLNRQGLKEYDKKSVKRWLEFVSC